jgi:hypothetical protein
MPVLGLRAVATLLPQHALEGGWDGALLVQAQYIPLARLHIGTGAGGHNPGAAAERSSGRAILPCAQRRVARRAAAEPQLWHGVQGALFAASVLLAAGCQYAACRGGAMYPGISWCTGPCAGAKQGAVHCESAACQQERRMHAQRGQRGPHALNQCLSSQPCNGGQRRRAHGAVVSGDRGGGSYLLVGCWASERTADTVCPRCGVVTLG